MKDGAKALAEHCYDMLKKGQEEIEIQAVSRGCIGAILTFEHLAKMLEKDENREEMLKKVNFILKDPPFNPRFDVSKFQLLFDVLVYPFSLMSNAVCVAMENDDLLTNDKVRRDGLGKIRKYIPLVIDNSCQHAEVSHKTFANWKESAYMQNPQAELNTSKDPSFNPRFNVLKFKALSNVFAYPFTSMPLGKLTNLIKSVKEGVLDYAKSILNSNMQNPQAELNTSKEMPKIEEKFLFNNKVHIQDDDKYSKVDFINLFNASKNNTSNIFNLPQSLKQNTNEGKTSFKIAKISQSINCPNAERFR